MDNQIDTQLLRSVQRQLRAIKIMLGFFALTFLVMIAVLGFIAYKVITFTQQINNKITSFENKTTQNLDFKNKICENKSITSFLGSSNDLCE
jgi:cell division protein FtsL